jgi:5-methylcytosine-specific restriction endonuclease McrA
MNKKKLVREHFRTKVFTRDKHRCRVCGKKSDKLDAHHVTDRNEMPNGGYVKENGISLCQICYLKAEQHHLGHEVESGFMPADLYKLIGSSYELAYAKSESEL